MSNVGRGLVTAAAVALMVTGCGTDSESTVPPAASTAAPAPSGPTAARTDFNDADVGFVENMYPHHLQALELVELVPTRSQNTQVLNMASKIDRAQYPELGQISGLLRNFGKPAPPVPGHAPGMPAMDAMPGMLSGEQMASLKGMSGKDFGRMWLSMMIEHHDGALVMSRTELASGINPNARGLAEKIIAVQKAEIAQMQGILG